MNIEGHSVEEGSLPGNTFAASALYSGSRKNAVALGPFTPRTASPEETLVVLRLQIGYSSRTVFY